MPTSSIARANTFRNILARMVAALREQREIEARRAIRRYRHLLALPSDAPPCEAAPAYDALVNRKEHSEHAHGPDAHQSAPDDAFLERA